MNRVAIPMMALAVACGCGSKPTPKPPPAELEIAGPASFAGRWVANDDLDFGYQLTITADGAYTLTVDRGKLSRCETAGTLLAGSDARHYSMPQARVTCDGPPGSAAIDVAIASFTGDRLVVETSSEGTAQRRTFARAPEN